MIRIGDRFRIRNDFIPVELSCQQGGVIEIGSNVWVNYGALISARKRIVIGDNVLIGNLSIIADSPFPSCFDEDRGRDSDAKPIEICDDVWLASRVTVLPGARIGRGSVIAAGSIVAGDIPPAVIAFGNPARPVVGLEVAGERADWFLPAA
jgi:maltose O-acetyltransferase